MVVGWGEGLLDDNVDSQICASYAPIKVSLFSFLCDLCFYNGFFINHFGDTEDSDLTSVFAFC